MALRDWSASRILGIWTAWMAGLLVALLAGVVFSPDGVVTITLSGVGSSLAMRAAFGVFGLAAACLPPAIVTYAWYVGRVREWGGRARRNELRNAPGDADEERRLAEGTASEFALGQRQRMGVPRDKGPGSK